MSQTSAFDGRGLACRVAGSHGGGEVRRDLLAQMLKAFCPPFPQHLLLLFKREMH